MNKHFTPTGCGLRSGAVTVLRALTGNEADLDETGPMFAVRYVDSGETADAFEDELS